MTTGTLSLSSGGVYYALQFGDNGWLAADMVQYLPDLYASGDPETAILKLLGYTMEVSREAPARQADHWVEVLMDERVLETNSPLIRQAVRKQAPAAEDPWFDFTLRRVHAALDRLDFTVRLIG